MGRRIRHRIRPSEGKLLFFWAGLFLGGLFYITFRGWGFSGLLNLCLPWYNFPALGQYLNLVTESLTPNSLEPSS